MKRLAMVFVVSLIALGLFGCPINNNNNTGPMNKDQTAKWIKGQLKESGFNADVFIQDIDENGLDDYVVIFKSLATNKEKSGLDFLISVTGLIGIVNSNIDWQSDKVVVKVGEEVLATNAASLQRCMDLVRSEAGDDDVAQCVVDAWAPEESGTQPTGEQPSQPGNFQDMPL